MVPETDDTDESRPRTEDVSELGFDPDALHRVVRAAMKDALLDVIGTLLLVGVAVVLVIVGVGGLLSGTAPGVAVGAVLAVAGCYLAAASLELVPPIREWA